MVRSFEVRKTRKGDNFGSARINLGHNGDFAEVDAKIWALDGLLGEGQPVPAAGDVLEIDYKEDAYQGRPQYVIRRFRRLEGEERLQALESFRPPDRIDRAFYRDRLEQLIEATSPERASGQVLRLIYDQAGFRETFFAAPAATHHHQNYPGGLLEHTLNVTSVALSIAETYAGPTGLSFNCRRLFIDRDVLVVAGLLHDIGKIHTHELAPLPQLTEANHWEGHLARTYAWVRREAEPYLEAPPYPEAVDEIHKLLHCILAHHGSLEYGSPVTPACAEAFILAQADLTDARLADIAEAAREAFERDAEARWLPRRFHFPGGLFVGDWRTREDLP